MIHFKNIAPLLLFLVFFNKVSVAQSSDNQPNIIFILVDDQGYGDVGAFYQNQRAKKGKPHERSPHLDSLAYQGAMFTQQYAAAPVCAPSRASIMSGESQGHTNVRDNQFDKALEDNYNMPLNLKKLGYKTAIVGKWGLQGDDQWQEGGDDWPARPPKRGFDHFFGYMRHSDGHEHYPKEGPYKGKKEVWKDGEVITEQLDKSYTTDLWTAAAKHWIIKQKKDSNKDKPFFLYLAYDTPHATDELPTQKYPKGGGLQGGIQWIGKPGNFINTASGKVDSYIHPDYSDATYKDPDSLDTQIDWPETYKRYATANRRIDNAVGDIMQLVKDLDMESNTLIVYTSDNGVSNETYLGDWQAEEEQKLPTFFRSYGPFDGIKRDNWEGGLRMPTIAWWPGHIAPHTKIESPNIQYDWAPTFIDAAGQEPPAKMDGVSLLPIMMGKDNQDVSNIYMEYYFNGKTPAYNDFTPAHRGRVRKHMQNIRLGDYMGVRYNVQSADDDFEIYNVREDPQEAHNLANTDMKVTLNTAKGSPKEKMGIKDLQNMMKEKVLQRRLPAEDISRPFDSTLVASDRISENKIAHGVNRKFFKGHYPWIPQVKNLKESSSGQADSPNGDSFNTDEDGLLYYSGYIKIPEDGRYTFYLKSDNPVFLRLHDIQAIDADYDYKGEERKRTIPLKKGMHSFRLYYQIKKAEKNQLELKWSGPAVEKQILKGKDLFREK